MEHAASDQTPVEEPTEGPALPIQRRICVFCGSRTGESPLFQLAAEQLGTLLARERIDLVYGGGSVGLMGVLADAVLRAGGHVIGVLPEHLATRELLHPDVPDMRIVPSMHARKALMSELSDAFIALPGGYGTLEEVFEVITWTQLGIQHKCVGWLNVAGFYDHLFAFLDHAIECNFIKPRYRDLFVAADQPEELLRKLLAHEPPKFRRWADLTET